MSRITEITTETVPSPLFKPSPEDAALLRHFEGRLASLVRQLNERLKQVDQELDPGNPGVGTVELVRGNFAGQWVRAVVTAAGLVTFTHNLGLPVVPVPGRAYNHPNVTWFTRFSFGDATGVNAAPAAPAATLHSSLQFRFGDAVTANAIELRVHTDLAIGATAPLNVDIRFFPAIV